jgi:vacuolar-type H+-ATPase subunit H
MRINPGEGLLVLGEKPQTEFGNPEPASGEVPAILEVSGGGIKKSVEALVKEARSECPEANCCLRAVCRNTKAEVDEYDSGLAQDCSREFDTLTVTVRCETNGENCGDRVEALTERIGEFATASIGAKAKADREAAKITNRATKEAKRILADPKNEAKKVENEAKKTASKQRRQAYADVHKQFKTRRRSRQS